MAATVPDHNHNLGLKQANPKNPFFPVPHKLQLWGTWVEVEINTKLSMPYEVANQETNDTGKLDLYFIEIGYHNRTLQVGLYFTTPSSPLILTEPGRTPAGISS